MRIYVKRIRKTISITLRHGGQVFAVFVFANGRHLCRLQSIAFCLWFTLKIQQNENNVNSFFRLQLRTETSFRNTKATGSPSEITEARKNTKQTNISFLKS